MNETMRAKAATRIADYATDRHVVTDGTAARINARLTASGLTRHVATLRRGRSVWTETFWAYTDHPLRPMAESVAANFGAELVAVDNAK